MNRVISSLRRVVADQVRDTSDADLLARFVADRDEAAFTALVLRHGGMVYRVCRSGLRNEQDAEDACQATFLVLAEGAARVSRPASLASWLHGVALRTCRRARVTAARRDAQVTAPAAGSTNPAAELSAREASLILHEELARLPERYRAPLVLCYLEGKSHESAATELGWTPVVFRGRLDRARQALRRGLERRGVCPSAALLAAALGADGTRLFAAGLAGPAGRAAALGLEKAAAGGTVSPAVFRLTQEVLKTMTLSPFKLAAAGLAILAFVAGVGFGPAALSGQPAAAGSPTVGLAPAAAPAPRDTLTAVLGQRGYVAVPLARAKSGTLDVEVLANGRRLLLVLDTGAAHTTLDVAHAGITKQEIGLEKQEILVEVPEKRVNGGGGKEFDELFEPARGDVEKFAVGGVTARLEVRFRKDSPANGKRKEAGDPPSDGVLGGDFLKAHAAVIDYATATLYIRDPARK